MIEGFIITTVVGVICILLGISNMRGNINSLHSYHRKRVTEEDRLPFGKLVGAGTVTIGASIVLMGVFSLLSELLTCNPLVIVGTGIMIVGVVVGLCISFYAMMKYNKGIF